MKACARDVLAALSLANLSLLYLWNCLLNYSPANAFFLKEPPTPSQCAAGFTNTLLFGIVFFLLIRLTRWIHFRYGAGWSSLLAWLMFLPAANAIRYFLINSFPHWQVQLSELSPFIYRGALFTLAILTGAAIFVLGGRRLLAAGYSALLVLSPLIAVEALFVFKRTIQAPASAFVEGPPALRAFGARLRGPRVIWVIFDELDYRLAFPGRPSGLALPQLDRLRAEAFFASNAIPPANDTSPSVPSLLTGVKWSTLQGTGPSSASLTNANGVASLHFVPNIFSSVQSMGGNTAVAGWYLPYCRIFASELMECSWHDIESPVSDTRGTFAQSLAREAQFPFEGNWTYSPFRESLRARHHRDMIHAMRDEAARYVADPSLDLVFLHLPVPHQPYIYDRASHSFTRRNAGLEGYLDAMAFADLWLGELREAMVCAGQWDSSAVLVSSDHHFRESKALDGKDDLRVPFLLKLPAQTSQMNYGKPVETIATKALLESILRGEVKSPEDTAAWLDRRFDAHSSESAIR